MQNNLKKQHPWLKHFMIVTLLSLGGSSCTTTIDEDRDDNDKSKALEFDTVDMEDPPERSQISYQFNITNKKHVRFIQVAFCEDNTSPKRSCTPSLKAPMTLSIDKLKAINIPINF